MRKVLTTLVLAAATMTAACGGRQVDVVSSPTTQQSETSVAVTNNLTQAVNVYVTSGGTDMFLRQVPAGNTETLPVRGISSGSSVTLKATTVDGTRTYTKDNVMLSGTTNWSVP